MNTNSDLHQPFETPHPVVTIAYRSGCGHTAVIADAVARGAADAGACVVSIGVGTRLQQVADTLVIQQALQH